MFNHLFFILRQIQCFQNPFVPFNNFRSGKTNRYFRTDRMVFDQMHDSVQTAVNGSVVIIFITKIHSSRFFLIVSNMYCMACQFIYSFKEWEGYTSGMTVSDNVQFNAVFNETLREYTVQFFSDGKIVQSTVMKYGETIVPPEDPEKTSEDGIDYRFTGWGGYTSGMTVTGDVIFDALFIESDHEYTIRFVVDGMVYDEQKLLFEQEIVAPEDPVKETAGGIKYTFAGWEGYTPGMTVSDDATFTAVFTESPVDDGSGSTIWIIAVVVVVAILAVAFIFFRKFH